MANEEEFVLEDGSNDKAYFTMVPNIVLNHSSAIDQALYTQMKRFAGEKRGGGLCTASHRTLMGKLKIGPKALKTSLEYLIGHNWIENAGARKVMTDGGPQDVQIYRVNDIWRMNVEHYKGGDESAPLNSKGGDERNKGANERSKGGDESAPTKNYIKQIEYSALEDEPRIVIEKEERSTRTLDEEEISPRKRKDEFEANYADLCSWAEARRGSKFPFGYGAQFTHLKKAREAGIGPVRLKKRWQELESQDFYAENGLDWKSVVSSFNRKP